MDRKRGEGRGGRGLVDDFHCERGGSEMPRMEFDFWARQEVMVFSYIFSCNKKSLYLDGDGSAENIDSCIELHTSI